MTLVEENEKYPCTLKLWRTTEDKVFIQVGPEDGNLCEMQSVTLDTIDARLLIQELQRIVKEIEQEEQGTPQTEVETLPLWAQHEKEIKKKVFTNT